MKQKSHEWLPLSQHGDWTVEYCLEERSVRLRLGEASMYMDRDAYLLLWATLTEGLDAMELAEDEASRITGILLDAGPLPPNWSQTRH
jgi:hypothetical protein